MLLLLLSIPALARNDMGYEKDEGEPIFVEILHPQERMADRKERNIYDLLFYHIGKRHISEHSNKAEMQISDRSWSFLAD